MMIGLKLQDDQEEYTFYGLEDSLEIETVEGGEDIETINGSLHTFNTFLRRIIKHKWSYMDSHEFEKLQGFYNRQFELFKYPRLTIAELNIKNTPVRLAMETRNIIDQCLTAKDIAVEFREAVGLAKR